MGCGAGAGSASWSSSNTARGASLLSAGPGVALPPRLPGSGLRYPCSPALSSNTDPAAVRLGS